MTLPGQISLDHIDGPIVVRLKPNPRAKRLILRLDARSGEPVATVPNGINENKVRAFLQTNIGWLTKRQKERAPHIAFTDGNQIPVRGIPHRLVHVGQRRGTVRLLQQGETHSLLISGDSAHMERRVSDWLKKQARADLAAAVEHHSSRLDVTASAIRIKDTVSRWGSCSSARVLSFSWRIIMAPPFALDYLVAHEVAHLREMNHSPRFWAHVAQTCPDFENGRDWLRRYGKDLHCYGISS